MSAPDSFMEDRDTAAAPGWSLIDSIGDGICVTDSRGVLMFCNASLAGWIAKPATALLGTDIFALFEPNARTELRQHHAAVIAMKQVRRASVRVLHPCFCARAVLRPLEQPWGGLASAGHPAGHVVWCFADITHAAWDCCFEPAMYAADVGFWQIDIPTGEVHWWNDWCACLDLDPCLGPDHVATWNAANHPDDQQYNARYQAVIEGRAEQYEAEYRHRTRSGSWRWLVSRGRVAARDRDGRALLVAGVVIDIDARKRAELALRKAEERYQIAVDAAQLPVWEHDVRADVVKGNVYWHRNLGYDLTEEQASQRAETWLSDIHPEDAERMAYLGLQPSGSSGFYETEFRMKTRTGEYKWLLDRGRITLRDAHGEPLKLSGISLDIDSRKRMELALRDSEARLETAVWGSELGLWDWNLETDALLWLSDWPTRYGIGTDPRTSHVEWLARMHPADRPRYAEDNRLLIEGSKTSAQSDYRILSPDGVWRWVNVRTRVIERSAAGRARRLVGACIGVDARRRAEQLLRTQAIILETMREAVALIDPEGLIEFTNPAFDRMFGHAPGALAGMSVFPLLNLRKHDNPKLSPIEGAMRRFNGRTGKRDALFRRRDGSRFAGEAILAKIELNGEKKGLIVIQDVSERKELEREIIEIANRERRRLGSDLHDGLGQELTGISLMLRSLAKNLSTAARPGAPEIDEIIALVNHAIRTARTMALGLSPVTLAHGGLLAALETLVSWSRENYAIDVRLRLMLRSELIVTEAMATHLYLIAQESINNAVKHGSARAVTITLSTNQSIVILTIVDDGVGVSTPLRSTGMGVKIMEYRAGMIGGTFQIKRRQKGGTRIRCVCPQASNEADP
jgi:PAS domain S-box-containing protein